MNYLSIGGTYMSVYYWYDDNISNTLKLYDQMDFYFSKSYAIVSVQVVNM